MQDGTANKQEASRTLNDTIGIARLDTQISAPGQGIPETVVGSSSPRLSGPQAHGAPPQAFSTTSIRRTPDGSCPLHGLAAC